MATKTGSRNHTHKYYKNPGDKLWHCGLGNCTHFMPQNMPESVMIGRNSICWECEKEFELSRESVIKDNPLCEVCTENLKKTQEYLKEKGLL